MAAATAATVAAATVTTRDAATPSPAARNGSLSSPGTKVLSAAAATSASVASPWGNGVAGDSAFSGSGK